MFSHSQKPYDFEIKSKADVVQHLKAVEEGYLRLDAAAGELASLGRIKEAQIVKRVNYLIKISKINLINEIASLLPEEPS